MIHVISIAIGHFPGHSGISEVEDVPAPSQKSHRLAAFLRVHPTSSFRALHLSCRSFSHMVLSAKDTNASSDLSS